MINKYSNEPLYCQLKSIIIRKIENGEYQEDEKIPSELELCQEYNISRPTVRQAITELANNGYLYKVRGKGTFVAKTKKRIDIKDYSGFTPSILDCQSPENRIIINTRIIKDSELEKLRSIFNIPVAQYSRVEFAEAIYQTKNGSDIYSINISYIPLSLFPNIINSILSCHASHEILKGKYPLVPEKTKSTLEVIYSNQEDTRYLQIQTGQPLIKIENMIFSKSGQLVEYVTTKYRADKCRLIFENLR
ncbi:MAG: GntR family transcriptional regulator [Firmicutes bacterium]|nr:GntR family transcriptional regulator [Bacillota bacterium]